MFKWAQQQLAHVAGTQEPIYGPDAIQPVTKHDVAYTELKKEHLKWTALSSIGVETQTFYLFSDSGSVGFLQVIYSNVTGFRTTCHFNCKIFNHLNGKEPHLWSSDALDNCRFSDDKCSFFAENCSLELNEDGSQYRIKSSTNKKSVVDITVMRAAPGFMAGTNGTSFYGEDPNKPWGSMRHCFWPRCKVQGNIMTQQGPVDFAGRGMFVHALQGGMKPNLLAARWNFVNFQSPSYSAVMMEFTTPPSYGTTTVNVGGIAGDGVLYYAGPAGPVTHTDKKEDSLNDWPEPVAASYKWAGKTAEGKSVEVDLDGPLGQRLDRVDIMAEVPGFVKQIVNSAAGIKPYIYQYAQKTKLCVKIGGELKEEEGLLFAEATFISDVS